MQQQSGMTAVPATAAHTGALALANLYLVRHRLLPPARNLYATGADRAKRPRIGASALREGVIHPASQPGHAAAPENLYTAPRATDLFSASLALRRHHLLYPR